MIKQGTYCRLRLCVCLQLHMHGALHERPVKSFLPGNKALLFPYLQLYNKESRTRAMVCKDLLFLMTFVFSDMGSKRC